MVLKKCILLLQDGKVFNGFSCGADGEAAGELVFNTAVFGYQEIVTDPATAKQLLIRTLAIADLTTKIFSPVLLKLPDFFLRNTATDIPTGVQTFQ